MIISLYDQDHLNNKRELVSFPLPRKDGLPCQKLGNNAPEALCRASCIIVFGSGTELRLSDVSNTSLGYLFSHYDVPIFSWLQYLAFSLLCGSLQV